MVEFPLALRLPLLLCALVFALGGTGCDAAGTTASATPRSDERTQRVGVERLRLQVVEAYPHDPSAFTQGLVLAGGRLFESTGARRAVEPA
jgi:glutamine cyclotransferase